MVKQVRKIITVKVELGPTHARIRSKPGDEPIVDMYVPRLVIEKRFHPNETLVYFFAQIRNTVGALEISERREGQTW